MSNGLYPNLDQKQVDLLNKKMQNFDEDNPIGNNLNAETGPYIPNESSQTPPADTILRPPFSDAKTVESRFDEMKQKIQELEQELGDTPKYEVSEGEMTFRDSSGNETFYVKNISGKHVVVSDINDMAKIPVGKSSDLLKLASIEDIKKSRDLRNAMYGLGSDKLLQRLTEKEYFNEKLQERDQKKRIDIMRQQDELNRMQNNQNQSNNLMPHERPFNSNMGNDKTVRPVVLAKLGKLALKNNPDVQVSRQAMTSPEFVSWIYGEKLTGYEIEYIMGDPNVVRDHDIRAALLEKRRSIPSE